MAETVDSDKAIRSAKEKTVELANDALEKTSEAVDKLYAQTKDTIAAHPYKSVLIAFGIGALLGVILARKQS